MPHFISELFELAGENTSDHFHFKKKDVSVNIFGKMEDLYSFWKSRKFLDEVEFKFHEPREKVIRYLKRRKKI